MDFLDTLGDTFVVHQNMWSNSAIAAPVDLMFGRFYQSRRNKSCCRATCAGKDGAQLEKRQTPWTLAYTEKK